MDKLRWIILASLTAGTVCAYGQATNTDIIQLLTAGVGDVLAGKSGWQAALLAWVGLARTFLKPGWHMVCGFIKDTPWTWDDNLLTKLQTSKNWQSTIWLINYVFSIDINKLIAAKKLIEPVVAPVEDKPKV